MPITYRTNADPSLDDLLALYDSVGWTAYTRAPETLHLAVRASLRVITAWDAELLVGLARIVGDGFTIAYLQDILVNPRHHRRGIGRELFQRAFEPFARVRQHILITDDDPAQHAFYRAMGFTEIATLDSTVRAYARFS